MKVVNFELLEIEKADRYKEIPIKLILNEKLDLRYSQFTEELYQEISEQIEKSNIVNYDGPVVFQFYTDLERTDLKDLRDLIISGLVQKLLITKEKTKHDELRLGIPKGFNQLEIMQAHLMDFVNFKLLKEVFEIEFYDFKNRLYKPMISRKV